MRKKEYPLWLVVLVFVLSLVLLLEGSLKISTETKQSIIDKKPPQEQILAEHREKNYGIILFEDSDQRYLMEYQKNLFLPLYQYRIKTLGQKNYDQYQFIRLPLKIYQYRISDDREILMLSSDLSPLFPYALFLFGVSSYLLFTRKSTQKKAV